MANVYGCTGTLGANIEALPGTPATVSRKMIRFSHASIVSFLPGAYPVSLSKLSRVI